MPQTDSLNVVQKPACRHLLSKGMFVTGQLNPAEDPVEPTSDGHCWCDLTADAIGPDEQMVERETCVSSRPCYEAR